MRPGDPDGHGRYGYADEYADGLLCHECGECYRSLGVHAYTAHGMTADEYRSVHGIPQRVKLVVGETREALSEAATERIGTEAWQRMVDKRDPTAASRSRTAESFQRRGEDRIRQTEVAKQNIAGARKPITRRCIICESLIVGRKDRDTCSPLCARIATYKHRTTAPADTWHQMHSEGQGWSAIGRAYGVTHTNVRNTVLRYRKHLKDVEFLQEHGPGDVPENRTQA